MQDLVIRKITPNESPFLSDMLYEAIFVEEGQPKVPRSIIEEEHLAKYIARFGDQPLDLCFVAEYQEQLVGVCWGRLFSEENKSYGFIDQETPEISIALEKSFRNKGIGSQLIRRLIKEYQQLQVKGLSLSVDKQNKALKLYQKLGFTTFSESGKSLVMHLNIQESPTS